MLKQKNGDKMKQRIELSREDFLEIMAKHFKIKSENIVSVWLKQFGSQEFSIEFYK